MRLVTPFLSLDQVTGGTLTAGTVPMARTRVLAAGRTLARWEEEFAGGTATSGQIGQLGWNALLGGGAILGTAGTLGHPGRYVLSTGAVIANSAQIYLGELGNRLLDPAEFFDCQYEFQLNQVDAATEVLIGISLDGGVTTISDSIALVRRGADTNFFYMCRAAAVETRVDSGVAADTLNHYLRIRRISGAAIAFSLDGGAESTINTNVPIALLNPSFLVDTLAAADKRLLVDFHAGEITLSR